MPAIWQQDEQDDFARQRQQAVMALAKRLPMSLRAGRARAQIVLEETEEQPSRVRRAGGRRGRNRVGGAGGV